MHIRNLPRCPRFTRRLQKYNSEMSVRPAQLAQIPQSEATAERTMTSVPDMPADYAAFGVPHGNGRKEIFWEESACFSTTK
jgi:hypothetical protein